MSQVQPQTQPGQTQTLDSALIERLIGQQAIKIFLQEQEMASLKAALVALEPGLAAKSE